MSTAIVADIQRCTTEDGPGLRTTVFFKGCPLRCAWCHNPECIDPKPRMLCYPEKCIGCGRCEEGCYTGAKVVCGKEMTVEAVMAEILQDQPYYGREGGVTFSGGEPLLQRDFLIEILDACRKAGIHTAVETSLCIYDEEVFRRLDLVMADLKIWDSALHQQYTGLPNEQIKEHFARLNALGLPIIARTPVIPGVEQNIPEIAAFLKGLENVRRYELLPYHPLGEEKRAALGLEPMGFEIPSKEQMKELKQYVFLR